MLENDLGCIKESDRWVTLVCYDNIDHNHIHFSHAALSLLCASTVKDRALSSELKDKEVVTFLGLGIFPSLLQEVMVKWWFCAVGVLSSDCSIFQLCMSPFTLRASQSVQSVPHWFDQSAVQWNFSSRRAVLWPQCPAWFWEGGEVEEGEQSSAWCVTYELILPTFSVDSERLRCFLLFYDVYASLRQTAQNNKDITTCS